MLGVKDSDIDSIDLIVIQKRWDIIGKNGIKRDIRKVTEIFEPATETTIYDINNAKLKLKEARVWERIKMNFEIDAFPPRQGLGVAQINQSNILIFGGFSGKFLKDAYILNHQTKEVAKAPHQPQYELFSFQMPTIFDP